MTSPPHDSPSPIITPTKLLDPAVIRARLTGRSWWACLFTDGRVVHEWECDWTLLPYAGRRSVRLFCPNGQVATLDDGKDATGRLFQLKQATAAVGLGRATTVHIVGLVYGTDGQCSCAAWSYEEKKLLTFTDNVNQMAYGNIGALATDVLGLAPA